MAEVTLHPDSQAFPPGTAVKVYPRIKNSPYPAEGQPLGTLLEEPTVSTAGVLVVKGVTAEGSYIGWSRRGNTDYYITFVVPPAGTATGTSVAEVETLIAEKAISSASPTLTGTPTAPTAAEGTNNTQLANTKYADRAVSVEATARAGADTTEKGARETADALLLAKADNLASLASAATARTNLGLGSSATESLTAVKEKTRSIVRRTISIPAGQVPGNEILLDEYVKVVAGETRKILWVEAHSTSGTIKVAFARGEAGTTAITAYEAIAVTSSIQLIETAQAFSDKDRLRITTSAGATPKGLWISWGEEVVAP